MLKIRTYPDPALKKKAEPVRAFNKELANIARNMFRIMYNLNGVGLAANQVGLSQRLVVINPTRNEADELVLVNPRLVRTGSEVIIEDEGCLSLPGISVLVRRHKDITCEYFSLKGEKRSLEAGGLMAKILQHEIDHLNGVLCIDRISEPQRRAALRKNPLLSEKNENHE